AAMLVQQLSRSLRASSGDTPEAERGAVPAGGACNPASGRPRHRHTGIVRPVREELAVRVPASASALRSAAEVEQCRGRAPAGARPALLGARRPGVVIACRHGTPRVRPLSAPAPTGALPPRLRGDQKGSAPGALLRPSGLEPGRRSIGCLTK